jgi:hypothetical protein
MNLRMASIVTQRASKKSADHSLECLAQRTHASLC